LTYRNMREQKKR